MLRGIDHLVVVVPDLAAAAKSYAALGFSVVPGGRHPVGTHNQLIAFADGSYNELIAFYQKDTGHNRGGALHPGGGAGGCGRRPRRWYAAVLGQPGREVERHELDAAGVRFEVGPHALELVAPKGAGAASLNEWLRQPGAAAHPAPLCTDARAAEPHGEGAT